MHYNKPSLKKCSYRARKSNGKAQVYVMKKTLDNTVFALNQSI